MDFDAFVTGDCPLVPAEGASPSDGGDGSESDANTLGTPDDDGENESGFVDAFESDEGDEGDEGDEEPAAAEARRTQGMSLGSISALRSAAVAASAAKLVRVKEKTQQVAQSKKQALSNFNKKGGLVGWLHGEPGDGSESYDDDDAGSGDSSVSDGCAETVADSVQPSAEVEADLLRSASLPTDSISPATPAVRQHRSFPAQVSPNAAAQVPASEFLKKSLRGSQRASSLLGNLYGKVKKVGSPAATPPATPTTRSSVHEAVNNGTSGGGRIALQPSPRKERALQGACSLGFDEFSSASNDSSSEPIRQRAVPEDNMSPSLDARQHRQSRQPMALPVEGTEPTAAIMEEPRRVLLLNACLADPKLAAEFVNTVMPNDSALLKLLYSIEEFEALVSTEPIPALSVQVDYAVTVIDKFLVSPSSHRGDSAVSVLSKLPPSTATELKQTIEKLHLVSASALPKTLFRVVYDVVYETLREGYDAFKLTREYTLLLEQRQQERADTVHVPTIDAILANEWCCMVFWMHLYRTSHHHRLSFLMEKSFQLDKLHAAFLQSVQMSPANDESADHVKSARAAQAYQRLVTHLTLVSRKFLQQSASVALPTAAPNLCCLKDELCVEIGRVPRDCSEQLGDAVAVVERLMNNLDVFAAEVRKEFKHLSFERFASFTASALYRDFVANLLVLPSSGCSPNDAQVSEARSSRGDIVQLLRAARIPFHQAPNKAPEPRRLSALFSFGSCADPVVSPDAIFKVFTFTTHDVGEGESRERSFNFEDLTDGTRRALTSSDAKAEAHAGAQNLYQTVEHFLLPEVTTSAFELPEPDTLQNVCYNFVAGEGDSTVYGAAWRRPVETSESAALRGVCVTSKFPLVDSLRCFLQTLAHGVGQLERKSDAADLTANGELLSAVGSARAALERYLIQHHSTHDAAKQAVPQVDFSLEDLFDCLSLTHVLRLAAFVLLEKKIVLVSSSYSVLLAVGEALKTLIYPLTWSHIYVPVLPLALKECLHCPTPFIFGLHRSYVRKSDLPRPSEDLVIVNLDRDSLTGGGDVVLPPALGSSLRDKLFRFIRPRLQTRDDINYCPAGVGSESECPTRERFPVQAIRDVFHDELLRVLASLESFAFRFEFNGKSAAVVDASNKTRTWTAEASSFHTALLQTQAFSAHLSSLGGCQS